MIWKSIFWKFDLKWSRSAPTYKQQLTKYVMIGVMIASKTIPNTIVNRIRIYHPKTVLVLNGTEIFNG